MADTQVMTAMPTSEADRCVPVGEYLAELRARRRELGQARPGEARALGLAIGYLQVATPARTAWLLREVLEAERSRPGEFWAESCRALRRIVRELQDVR